MSELAGHITQIIELLQEAGYRAKKFDDEAVSSSAAGLNFIVIAYSNSLQFRCSIRAGDSDREELQQRINEFNRSKRFAKLYLDHEGDPTLDSDWWIDLSEPNPGNSEAFDRAMRFFEAALVAMKQTLVD